MTGHKTSSLSMANSAPSAQSNPAEEKSEEGKDDRPSERSAAANASTSEKVCYGEQANGVEDEKCADKTCDHCHKSMQGILHGIELSRCLTFVMFAAT
jgi:hypothetical protein